MVKAITFKEYYEKNKNPEFGSIYNLVVIMRYLEEYEGYDFSKSTVLKTPKNEKKKYLMKDDDGGEYFL